MKCWRQRMHLCMLSSPYADALPPSVPSPLSAALGICYHSIAANTVCVSTPVLSFSADHPLPVLDTLGNNTVFLAPGNSSRHLVKTAG
jgi:hypothetical protein